MSVRVQYSIIQLAAGNKTQLCPMSLVRGAQLRSSSLERKITFLVHPVRRRSGIVGLPPLRTVNIIGGTYCAGHDAFACDHGSRILDSVGPKATLSV